MSQRVVTYRVAGVGDVPAMSQCRLEDPPAGPADERMALYFEGKHHPQHALPSRVGLVAVAGPGVIGYVAGHLTRRFDCQGELQYLFVTPAWRRSGVGRGLVRHLAEWLAERHAVHVCVNVNPESPPARPFYLSLGATHLRPYWMEWADIRTVIHP